MTPKDINKQIIEAIYNEMVHSEKLQHWKFQEVAEKIHERLEKMGAFNGDSRRGES